MKTHSPKHLAIIIAAAIVLSGGSFYAGMKYSQSESGARRAQFTGQFPQNGAGGMGQRTGMRQGSGFVNGEIISKDATSVTVKDRSGGSKIVFLADSTEVTKSAGGTINDLAIGTSIIANGKTNADGSITATMVQIRPEGLPGMGGPGIMPVAAPKQ